MYPQWGEPLLALRSPQPVVGLSVMSAHFPSWLRDPSGYAGLWYGRYAADMALLRLNAC